jgi:hypothetical protein
VVAVASRPRPWRPPRDPPHLPRRRRRPPPQRRPTTRTVISPGISPAAQSCAPVRRSRHV